MNTVPSIKFSTSNGYSKHKKKIFGEKNEINNVC